MSKRKDDEMRAGRGSRRVTWLIAVAGATWTLTGGCQTQSHPTSVPVKKESASAAQASATSPHANAAVTPAQKSVKPVATSTSEHDANRALRDYGVSNALQAAGPDAIEFCQHVSTLADPFFEGRSADTRGKKLAGEYVRFHFERAGLKPAFPQASEAAPDAPTPAFDPSQTVPLDAEVKLEHPEPPLSGSGPIQPLVTYEQPFTVPGNMLVNAAEVAFTAGESRTTFQLGADYNPLGMSGRANASGPLVYAGYGIDDGPDGYSSFKEGDDLKGKIALIFRFEPMDAQGHSLWVDNKTTGVWTQRSGLVQKVRAVLAHGAEGVIVVNPPGADDPRANRLETTRGTRFGQVDKPVIMLSSEAAAKLVAAADPEARSLTKLRELSDGSWRGVIDLPNTTVTLNVDIERERLATRNIGGILPGKGSLAGEYVIIGAHYDHVGYGYLAGASPANVGKLHPGADDNASGTSGLIMLAERLSKQYADLPEGASARTILFLAFGAEEMGLLGAQHFVKTTTLGASQMTAMLNMDMIGRVDSNKLQVSGVGSAVEWESVLQPLLTASGFDVKTSNGGQGPSDHAVFARASVPVLHFFSGTHPNYHQPTDTADRINCEGGARVVELIENVAMTVATRPERMTFKDAGPSERPGGPRTGAKVRLGIQPGDYDDDKPGVLVGGVSENSSAALAGVKPGDRLIRWNGKEVKDIYGMMERLGDHNPGDVVELVVIRDGAEVTLKATLQPTQTRG